MRFIKKYPLVVYLTCILFFNTENIKGQTLLEQRISLNISNLTLQQALQQIGQQGGFSFSYKTDLIPADSMVSIYAVRQTVQSVLDKLFEYKFQYKEHGNHIILQESKGWYIAGYISDYETGERIKNASIYDPGQLVATITNDQGYFKLKLKEIYQPAYIHISKLSYHDTSVKINQDRNMIVNVGIRPRDFQLDTVMISQYNHLYNSWYGKMLLSTRERFQSLNLNNFFVAQPVQFSILPNIGTHGNMSGQVVNNVSINFLGGYAAGVNGFEMAGLFNIIKGDVQYFQAAGLFNIAGGHARGMQVAGLYNQVRHEVAGLQGAGLMNNDDSSVKGLQVAGLYNKVSGETKGLQGAGLFNQNKGRIAGGQMSGILNLNNGSTKGIQAAGIININADTTIGFQVAGLGNINNKLINGIQVAGVVNLSKEQVKGVQISGVLNSASRVRGCQIGLVNIADTMDGCAIGLINLVKNGYHKFNYQTDEILPVNLSIKTGTNQFYTILQGGWQPGQKKQIISLGVGIGADYNLGKRFSVNPELIARNLYFGNWAGTELQTRAQVSLGFKIHKYISVYAGPSYNLYFKNNMAATPGYKKPVPQSDFNAHKIHRNIWGYTGWQFGINIF